MKASEWAFDRIKEPSELGAQDEAEKMSIVQEVILRSTVFFLRRTIAPVGGQGGVTMSYLCPNCNSFPLEDYVWWVSGRKSTKWWCAICEKSTIGSNRTGFLVVQTGDTIEQAKVFKVHAGLWANLINALANEQEDGDGFSQNMVKNLCKRSRRGLTDGLREFIKVDNERLRCWSATPGHGNI